MSLQIKIAGVFLIACAPPVGSEPARDLADSVIFLGDRAATGGFAYLLVDGFG
jgi:hypothetical protein